MLDIYQHQKLELLGSGSTTKSNTNTRQLANSSHASSPNNHEPNVGLAHAKRKRILETRVHQN
jgi:hypothetical protein